MPGLQHLGRHILKWLTNKNSKIDKAEDSIDSLFMQRIWRPESRHAQKKEKRAK